MAQPQKQFYGGVSLTPQELQSFQQAPSPDLSFAALDAIARTKQLDESKRKALFQFSGTKDYTKVSPLETFLNAAGNSGTSGLLDLPISPNQNLAEIGGNLAGGFGSSIGLTGGLAAILGRITPAAALAAPAVVGFGQGMLESLDEAQDTGYQFNPLAGALRGAQSAALNYLPGIKQAKGFKQLAGTLLKNAGIAGLSEGAVSPISQALTYGEVNPYRLGSDVAQQVGAQLGGDALERFHPTGLRDAAFDNLKRFRKPQLDVKAEIVPSGVVSQGNADTFGEMMQRLEGLAQANPKNATSMAKQLADRRLAESATYAPDSPEHAALRQQARTLNGWVQQRTDISNGEKATLSLDSARQALTTYSDRGDTKNITTLYRAARKSVGTAKTPQGKEAALMLEQEALTALRKLGVDPTAPKAAPTQKGKTLEQKQQEVHNATISKMEELQAQYDLVKGDKESTDKDFSKISNKARAIETNPKSPDWVREYAASVRRDADADLEYSKNQKAINDAKARTSNKANKTEKPIGLNSLKEDITTRSKEAASNEARQRKEEDAAYKKLKQEEDANRKALVVAAKKSEVEAAKVAKVPTTSKQQETNQAAATAFKNPLDKTYDGMNGKTPRQFEKMLDSATNDGAVYRIDYYAERGLANEMKPLLKRYVTIESNGVDPKSGLKKYFTIDQKDGDAQTRILFAGAGDSRITKVEKTRIKPIYKLNSEGRVVNIKTGEISTAWEQQATAGRVSTAAQERNLKTAFALADEALKPLAGQPKNKVIAVYNGFSKPKKLLSRFIDAHSKMTDAQRKKLTEDVDGGSC